MRTLLVTLFFCFASSAAAAGLDPDPDSMGIYFDTAGNSNCLVMPPFQQVSAYLLLMNPAGPVDGFECSVTMTGAPYFILSTVIAGGGENWCYSPNCYASSSAWSLPVLNGAALLVTWTIMQTSSSHLEFFIGPSTIASLPGGLPVVVGDGVLRRCGVASGDVNLPVASINGSCPVGDEVSSFGRVKGLFR
jgi:hypothetical protein